MELMCERCMNNIETRRYLSCSTCRNNYHQECTSDVGEKRFNLMTSENKSNWRCHSCYNITTRNKYKIKTLDNSFQSMSDNDTEDLDFTSVPSSPVNVTMSMDIQLKLETKDKIIESLQNKLEAAENKIKTLQTENILLQEQIQNNKIFNDNTGHTAPSSDIEINKPCTTCPVMDIQSMQKSNITMPIDGAKHKKGTDINSQNKNIKNKICILSTNRQVKLLPIAEKCLKNRFEICHYLTPGAGIRELMNNLEKKLTDFTFNDYCVIFIGEKDFFITEDYVDLVLKIRETTSKIKTQIL